MMKDPSWSWRFALALSCALAVVLVLLVHRAYAQLETPPELLWVVFAPPRDGWLPWYPISALVPLSVAFLRRSIRLVVATQLSLFVIGFLHVMWLVGTVPVKIDFRIVLVALTGHAITWASYACAVTALAIGVRNGFTKR
jgi:hypothetical protein